MEQLIKELVSFIRGWLIRYDKALAPPPVLGAKDKLAIIVGHEMKAMGAVGAAPISAQEYTFNGQWALELWAEAQSKGLECQIFKRDGIGISGVALAASKWCEKEGCVIELHFNAANGTVVGTETLYDSEPLTSKAFAQRIHNAIIAGLSLPGEPRRDRGLKLVGEKDLGNYSLRNVTVDGCLVEPMFGDNPVEAKLFVSQRLIVTKKIIQAVLDYFAAKDKI